jgi:hypothetical protein
VVLRNLASYQEKPGLDERVYILRLHRLFRLSRRKYIDTPKPSSCNDDGSYSPVDEVEAGG